MFVGFQTPMVMSPTRTRSRTSTGARRTACRPGRSFALESVMGARSVLLLDGDEHLARRKLMLPAIPRRAHACLRGPWSARSIGREIDSWPRRSRVRNPPADAGGDAGGDPARRLRRHRRPSAWSGLRGLLGEMLADARLSAAAGPRALGSPLRTRRTRSVELRAKKQDGRRAAAGRDRRASRRPDLDERTTSSRCSSPRDSTTARR